jgi:ABC-type transport system involved in multi-copper enzyme maturation permease subunit
VWNKQISALMAKDFRLHGRAIVGIQGGAMLLIFLIGRAVPGRGISQELPFLFSLNYTCALFIWGDWLISREKIKGTFAWLRTLPISDRSIVTSKFLTCGFVCISMWIFTSFPFTGGYFSAHWLTWIIIQLSLLAVAAISLAVRFRFTQKLGQILPALLVGVLVLPFVVAHSYGLAFTNQLTGLWNTVDGKALATAGLIALSVLAWWITARWMSQCDIYEILE